MHALLQDILPFVVAFYLAESLALVVAGEHLFVSLWGGFVSAGQGLRLAALTPWAVCYSSFRPQLDWGDGGVRFGSDELTVSFEAMSALGVDGHRLRLTESQSLQTPGLLFAGALRDRLEALRDAPEAGRGRLFASQCQADHDLSALRARLRALDRSRTWLMPVQTGLFATLFVLVPLSSSGGSATALQPAVIVGGVLALTAAALVLGYKLLRACGRNRWASARPLLGFLLFPPGCVHLFALVARPLLADFAPLALAAALLPESAFRRLARQRLRLLALRIEEVPWAGYEVQAVLRLVVDRGLRVDEVLRAPVATDPSASSYCPICSEEYRAGFDRCAECGVRLEPLARTGFAATAPVQP